MSESGPHDRTVRRALIVIGIVAVALFLWQIVDALLLLFMGVLLAVFLRGLARRVSELVGVPEGWSVGIVVAVLLAAFVGASLLLGPRISEQFQQLSETLPQSIDQLRSSLEQTSWGRFLLQEAGGGDGLRLGGDLFSQLTGVASTTLGIATNVVLILFAAIFFAVDPGLYRRGGLLLVPEARTDRFGQVLDATGNALWRWLMGRLIAMVFVGVTTAVGLWLVGVPLAMVLGLLAGLLDFVPFIGPLAAATPGVLLALTLGPMEALYAALVYLVVQQLEGNLVTPLVQQKEVSLPPVLVLFAIVASGLLFGLMGVIVATPLAVVVLVWVKMLYVEDVLGKEVSIPGQ